MSFSIECFECGKPAQHAHHVVPRSLGGSKTVPLCISCHGLVHRLVIPMNHAELVREGLKKAQAVGKRLGNPNRKALLEGSRRGVAARKQHARRFAESMMPLIQELQDRGLSLRKIAVELNERGVPTVTGKGQWTASQLWRTQRPLMPVRWTKPTTELSVAPIEGHA